mmetsp:Transcript_91959/g.268933  ORF Transcript_91959/g.268933 Transcript_91959/m.268933 type:complete len:192 (-) Transcript_91959:378-953(-)
MQAVEIGNVNAEPEQTQNGLLHMNTSARLEVAKEGASLIPVIWCATGCCCFWIPMVFFFAAANVLQSCEQDLSIFLKVYGLVSIVLAPCMQTMIIAAAWAGSETCFKFAGRLHLLTSALSLGLMAAGWVFWHETTDTACYDPDGAHDLGDINPRTLLFVWVIIGTAASTCVACGVLCSVCGLAGRTAAYQS